MAKRNPIPFFYGPDLTVEPDRTKPYCCRCQKELANIEEAVAVTVDLWNACLLPGHDRRDFPTSTYIPVYENGYLGPDCWEVIAGSGKLLE